MDSDRSHIPPPSRRSFLKSGAAGAAAAAAAHARFGDSRAFAADAAAADYGGLVIGLQSYTFRNLSLEQTLAAMRNNLKIHAAEFFPQHLAGTSPARIKDLLDAHGVVPLSYGVIPFTNDHEANRKMFELARAYGMTNLSCDPDPDSLASIDALAGEYGMTVAIHPHGPGHRWGTMAQLEKAFAGRSNRVGLCADTGHMVRAGEDPLAVMRRFKDRLHALHLKDFKQMGDGQTWADVPAGTANLDVDGIVKFLIDAKSRAAVFIEYEGLNPAPSARQSLDRVKEAVKKAKAQGRTDNDGVTSKGTR